MGVGRSQREEAVVKIGLCCQKRGGMAILGRVFAFGKQAVRMKYQVVGDHLPRHLLVRLPNRLVFGTMGRMALPCVLPRGHAGPISCLTWSVLQIVWWMASNGKECIDVRTG